MTRAARRLKRASARRATHGPAPATPPRPAPLKRVVPLALILAAASISLGGCGNMLQRISEVGKPPAFDPIENPNQEPGYQPISMPMPAPMTDIRQANSLWRQGSRTFFADQRASKVGDILTVVITINDSAKFDNKSTQTRDGTNAANAKNLLGFETRLNVPFPDSVDPANLINTSSTSGTSGEGTINRSETIDLRVAAIVTQVLPNGNLVLKGMQQVRVNYELRALEIQGIIRPQDISTDNAVTYDQIAEARISYGGKGESSDIQQPRFGQQLYDILFPF